MRDSALAPRISKKRRLCPDAVEPAGPLAEEITEEPMTLVDSVVYPVILCHPAEEFVSQDVVGE